MNIKNNILKYIIHIIDANFYIFVQKIYKN